MRLDRPNLRVVRIVVKGNNTKAACLNKGNDEDDKENAADDIDDITEKLSDIKLDIAVDSKTKDNEHDDIIWFLCPTILEGLHPP